MTTGYSKRPLIDKLGLKPGMRAALLHSPPGFVDLVGPLPPGVEFDTDLRGQYDYIHTFHDDASSLEAEYPALQTALKPAGMLWISWRKGQKTPGALNENIVRELSLARGLVDVKVIAVDAVWSGLKIMIRVRDR